MLTETYRGRRIRITKGRQWGTLAVTINGTRWTDQTSLDEAAVMADTRRWIDMIDREPVNGERWPAYWYAPGTYTLCAEGHPVALGGQCTHSWCRQQRHILNHPDGA